MEGMVQATKVDELIEAGLASRALRALAASAEACPAAAPCSKELRSGLDRARLTALARHAAVRAAVGPLLRAWSAAGLDVLVFKGFYLAESVYPDAADRAYSDVDVALRLQEAGDDPVTLAAVAAEVAARTGWHVVWRYGEEAVAGSLHDERYDGHELLQLVHSRTRIELDVHRRLVHNNVNVARATTASERVTAAVWSSSVTTDLVGARVRVPSYVDSAIVGLVAARSWSSDRHELRPHDYLDLAHLMDAGGFGAEELLERARQLGMYRTARSFLRRCDPTRRVFQVGAVAPGARLVLDLTMLPERWPRGVALAWRRAQVLAGEALATWRALPIVRAEVRRWRRGTEPHPVVAVEPGLGPARRPNRRDWAAAVLGVRRSMQLLGLEPGDHPALALRCLGAFATHQRLAVSTMLSDGSLSFLDDHTRLPLDRLGRPRGASRTAWPHTVTRPTAGRLVRAIGLGPARIAIRLEALMLLWLIRVGLERATFAAMQGRLARIFSFRRVRRPFPTTGETPSARVVELGAAISSASRFVPGARCVAQSLAGQSMLNRRGLSSRIHFGFRRTAEGSVSGHAWLEAGGAIVVGDEGLDAFTRTATFDA